jgi:hypothetical protein
LAVMAALVITAYTLYGGFNQIRRVWKSLRKPSHKSDTGRLMCNQRYDRLYEMMIMEYEAVAKDYMEEDSRHTEISPSQAYELGITDPEFTCMRQALYFIQKGIKAHVRENDGAPLHVIRVPQTEEERQISIKFCKSVIEDLQSIGNKAENEITNTDELGPMYMENKYPLEHAARLREGKMP